MQRYTVVSGKLEWWEDKLERNIKYIESFPTFEQAFTEWKRNRGYPVNEIECVDDEGVIHIFS